MWNQRASKLEKEGGKKKMAGNQEGKDLPVRMPATSQPQIALVD